MIERGTPCKFCHSPARRRPCWGVAPRDQLRECELEDQRIAEAEAWARLNERARAADKLAKAWIERRRRDEELLKRVEARTRHTKLLINETIWCCVVAFIFGLIAWWGR